MATKTIRLDEKQEERLAECMKLLKTNSAQRTFEDMLELLPKIMEDKENLSIKLRNEIASSETAKRILRSIHESQKSLQAFVEKL